MKIINPTSDPSENTTNYPIQVPTEFTNMKPIHSPSELTSWKTNGENGNMPIELLSGNPMCSTKNTPTDIQCINERESTIR